MKKLVLPIFMAVVGALAVVIVVLNVVATSPVTLKMLRINEVDYSLTGGDTITLTTGTDIVLIDARPTDGKAVVEVSGSETTVCTNSSVVSCTNFVEGNNDLAIKVTGSDGKTSAVYKVTLVKPKLTGWCQENSDLIKTVETNWADEQLYEMPGYAELGTYSADIKAHKECFSESLVTEIQNNY